MMWNWYASNNLIAYNGLVIQGEIIDIEATKDSIFIRNLPEDAIAYELIIDFDPSTFKTENNSPETPNRYVLSLSTSFLA